eukprot:jgi/Botrbrau1/2486/Bobra.0226s0043.1
MQHHVSIVAAPFVVIFTRRVQARSLAQLQSISTYSVPWDVRKSGKTQTCAP